MYGDAYFSLWIYIRKSILIFSVIELMKLTANMKIIVIVLG